MRQRFLPSIVVILATLVYSVFSVHADGPFPDFELRLVYPNLKLNRPVALEESPDGTGRFFAVEQGGRVLILPADRQGAETNVFLDLSGRRPHVDNEEGLLGFAFHPGFKDNGKFYVCYSQQNPRRNVVSEFQVAKANTNSADVRSERVLLQIPQPYSNHNGGAILFGPDGMLYISLGDGGAANDPHDFGQNLNTLLAKILRVDVNSKTGDLPYGIPKDNPFADRGDAARGEIWAYGLRNVWRMSFDRLTGDLWAGDVGQNKWEEIDVIVKGGNYGWNVREAFHPFKEPAPEGVAFIDPIIAYPHTPQIENRVPHGPGLSVTGGYVYRGKKLPKLEGAYIYADYQFGPIWALRAENGKLKEHGALVKPNPARPISSFAEDRKGEIYVLAFDGRIYELVEAGARQP